MMRQKKILMNLMEKIPVGYGLMIITITIYGLIWMIETSVNADNRASYRCEKLEKHISEILSAGL